MLQVSNHHGPEPSTSRVTLNGPASLSSRGLGRVRPWTIAPGFRAAASRQRSSQSGAASQSSSVNAISGARARRQPSLRARAGPAESLRAITVSSNGDASASLRSNSAEPSAEPSSTTITSNAAGSIVCSRSEPSRAARRRERSRVATTTLTAGVPGQR